MSVSLATSLALTPPKAEAKRTLRPTVRGKFIFIGEEKLYLRGVTYGTFRPDERGDEYPPCEIVELDFTQMEANRINAVRTYTPPPRWLLDAAQRHGLWVMVGLPVERSAAFFDYQHCARSIEEMVREKVRACAGHPAILCYTIGNEIPASVGRWHGRRRMERFIEGLYRIAKSEDPGGLVTYVNYPSTEYLQLPFLDFVCFNVYLESQARLEAYLARLHNLTCDRPLVLAEIGLDSLRHGEEAQARALNWQVRTSFAGGCAGVFVYAWTDEWFRGGAEVDDWKFGLTDRQRRPKPALAGVVEAFSEVPVAFGAPWPRVSVIVCTHNGARTLRDTCEGLRKLEYPDFEVIVVDDGSRDASAAIAREYGFKVISIGNRVMTNGTPGRNNDRAWVINTPNCGLSNARNVGLEAATGEIVAYIDDDAYPDPHWLTYLVTTLMHPSHAKFAAVGGPNIAPPNDGLIADCVAHAPGGPIHVLLTNRKAEHIPGCNMAFHRAALKAIGGFDPQFRTAGDDVDVCWRLQQKGWTLGFSPAAVVWHHRRNSMTAYWRQQRGYGKAEAMLERKWPEKYNGVGHATWSGRVYNNGLTYTGWRARRIYHGRWGLAPFQSLYEPAPNAIESLPMMPEWYLIILALGALSALRLFWSPLRVAIPAMLIVLGISLAQACRCATLVSFKTAPSSPAEHWERLILTAFLHLLQPLARLIGRVRHGLTFWRPRGGNGHSSSSSPRPWTADIWTKTCRPVDERLHAIEDALRTQGAVPRHGGDFDTWDLEVSGGIFGAARLLLAVDYHGSGRQLLRVRCWPRCTKPAAALALALGALVIATAWAHAWIAFAALGVAAVAVVARTVHECTVGASAFLAVVKAIEREEKINPE